MRRLPSPVVLVVAMAWSTGSGAAPMEHHDLASLWWEADHVVLAEERSRQYRVEEWNETVWYQVVEVYKGDLGPGEQVEVYDDAYRYELPMRWDFSDPQNPTPLPLPGIENRVFLFLRTSPPRLIREGVQDSGPLMKVPSGMRLIADGKVYRFEQWSNPGGYAPVPQGPDPDDVLGRRAVVDPQPLDLPRFAVELEQAAARAHACEVALAIEDPAERNAALLPLLPEPRSYPPVTRMSGGGFPADALSREILGVIAHGGDLDAVVEAYGRDVIGGFRTYDARRFLDPDREARGQALLDAALDPARPPHQRAAALHVLADNAYALREQQRASLERAATLLADPEPAVRAATVDLLGDHAHGDHREWALDRLVEAFAVEPDPHVRYDIARWLRTRDVKGARLDPKLTGDDALIVGATPGPAPPDDGAAVLLGLRYVIPHHAWSPQVTVHAVARAADGTEHRSAAGEPLWWGGGQDLGSALVRYPFDPPLPPGRYQVSLDVHLEPYQSPDRAPQDARSDAVEIVIPR